MVPSVPVVSDAFLEAIFTRLVKEAEAVVLHASNEVSITVGKNTSLEVEILESALSRLQTKIRHRQAELRQRQNRASAPIYRLPTEILANIFQEAVVDDADTSDELDFDYQTRKNLFNVSSWFLAIVLSTPALWAFITEKDIPIWEITIERSKSVPLDISCMLEDGDLGIASFLELILPHQHRWRSFYTKHPLKGYASELVSRGPAPLLESFTFNNLWHYPHKGVPVVGLFQHQAPRLRRLATLALDIPWDTLVPPSLEHLHIADFHGEEGPWARRYHQLFSSLKQLRSICIERGAGHITSQSVIIPTPIDTVALPKLESIDLQGLSSAITLSILSQISIPSRNLSKLAAFGLPFTSQILSEIFPKGKDKVLPSMLSKMSHIHLSHNPHNITFRASNAPFWRFDKKRKAAPLILGFDELDLPSSSSSLTQLFSTIPSFMTLRSLLVEGEALFGMGALEVHLPLFTDLEELTLNSLQPARRQPVVGVDAILRCLSGISRPCPRLRKLALENVRFQEQTLLEFVRVRCGRTSVLETILPARLSNSLETLVLTRNRCSFKRDVIEEIAQLVNQSGNLVLDF